MPAWLAQLPLSEWSGLLQAFAAFVALVLSTAALLTNERRERYRRREQERRETLQARCVAAALGPDLLDLDIKIEELAGFIPDASSHDTPLGLLLGGDPMDFQLRIPPLMERYLDSQVLLQMEAGAPVLRLIATIHTFNAFLDERREQEGIAKFLSFAEHVAGLRDAVRAARQQMDRLHPQPALP